MNANPYAAPQTLHARFHMQELPVAQARGNEDERRDFREFSTEQLSGFMQKSRAIDTAQIPWLLAAIASTIVAFWVLGNYGAITSVLSDPKSIPWVVLYICIILRFCAGIDRRRWMRPLIVGMDAALVAICGFCLLSPKFHHYFNDGKIDSITKYVFEIKEWYWAIVAVMIAMTYVVGKSGIAAFHAPELFSKHRYSHARLCQELDYRKEYGIE